jgi:hypothetical protein
VDGDAAEHRVVDARLLQRLQKPAGWIEFRRSPGQDRPVARITAAADG